MAQSTTDGSESLNTDIISDLRQKVDSNALIDPLELLMMLHSMEKRLVKLF